MTEKHAKPAPDPTALAQTYAEIAQRSSQLIGEFMQRQSAGGTPALGDELGIAKAFYEMTAKLLADPAKFAEMQMKVWKDHL